MSIEPQYPIICQNDADMTNLIPLVTHWAGENIHYHFNALTHLEVNCGAQKDNTKNGLQPGVKVIYVEKKLITQAKIIINQLNSYVPELEVDELQQRQPRNIMMCPVCGVNIKNQ